MIRYLLSFIFLSPALTTSNINPPDTWQIYYNKEKIQEFGDTKAENLLHIKARSVKESDSLIINYFTENTDSHRIYTLKIPTDDGTYFFEVSRSTKRISLSLKQILFLHKGNNWKPLPIFFVINSKEYLNKEFPVCSIKIE